MTQRGDPLCSPGTAGEEQKGDTATSSEQMSKSDVCRQVSLVQLLTFT